MTAKQLESQLNELYSSIYSLNDAIDNFCYFNDGKIRESTIENAYNNHELGSLFRKNDSIAFNVLLGEKNL